MRIISHILLIFIISISFSIYHSLSPEDKSNTANVENLKILRKSVNFAYKLGNEFLDLIGNKGNVFEQIKTFIQVKEQRNYKLSDVVNVCMPMVGYIILGVVGLLFAILMPIIGCCFCLCRCCGKCGGKVKGMDPRHATCKRYTYAVLLGIISVVMLGGIILAFINNQLIHDALTNPSEEINCMEQMSLSTKLMRKSLENVSEEIAVAEQTSQNNADIIKNLELIPLITTRSIQTLSKESFNSQLQDSIFKITEKLSEVIKYLQSVKKPNPILEEQNSKLIGQVKLLQISKTRESIQSLLTDLNSDFTELKRLMSTQNPPELTTGMTLRKIVDSYNTTITDYVDFFMSDYKQNVKNEYLEYRMYICIGVCCFLLLIVLFYFLGLCFGQCGERPFEDARICNRGVGANLMMAGVAFAFLFTPSIMMLTTILFLHGGPMQTEFCRYLTNSYEPGLKIIDDSIHAMIQVTNDKKYELKGVLAMNHLSSLVNRCPSMPMALAFNPNTDILSQPIVKIIAEITEKVKLKGKINIFNAYSEDIRSTLSSIEEEIIKALKVYSFFDPDTGEYLKNRLSLIQFDMKTLPWKMCENSITSYLNSIDSNGFRMDFSNEVKSILNKVYIGPYDNVKCVGMHNATKIFIDAACVTFLWPYNGFWFGVGICLVFTIPAIIFAVKLAGLYRHTEKYSPDYEEPDYHSYMGFYTNNADNIPMKKPKSGKVNQKSRNSNFNNKDSLKQTNPQYLPVYPYDAYE